MAKKKKRQGDICGLRQPGRAHPWMNFSRWPGAGPKKLGNSGVSVATVALMAQTPER